MERLMAAPAERMKMMRERRRRQGLREVRLVVPDARSPAVRARVAAAVALLNREDEAEALRWLEALEEWDDDPAR
jgi:hypothetical protein